MTEKSKALTSFEEFWADVVDQDPKMADPIRMLMYGMVWMIAYKQGQKDLKEERKALTELN